jgi:general stress protein YciG
MNNNNQQRANPLAADGRSKSSTNPGNFKNNPQKAAEAGRKGGKARSKAQ